MNNTVKFKFLVLALSLSSVICFSQNDTTKVSTSEKKLNSEIGTTKGNYQIKASSSSTKVKPPTNFKLKSDKKLNTAAINKNLKQNKPNPSTKNFLMEELPEDKDIIGKKYWKGKDVTHQKLRSDLSLGTISSTSKIVKIECRDHSYVDGDRIKIYLNEKVISNNIGLKSNYYVIYVNLKPGYNRIDFQALNQGFSGPNTAELNVYDEKGNLISAKEWNMPTGATATIGIIKK